MYMGKKTLRLQNDDAAMNLLLIYLLHRQNPGQHLLRLI